MDMIFTVLRLFVNDTPALPIVAEIVMYPSLVRSGAMIAIDFDNDVVALLLDTVMEGGKKTDDGDKALVVPSATYVNMALNVTVTEDEGKLPKETVSALSKLVPAVNELTERVAEATLQHWVDCPSNAEAFTLFMGNITPPLDTVTQ